VVASRASHPRLPGDASVNPSCRTCRSGFQSGWQRRRRGAGSCRV